MRAGYPKNAIALTYEDVKSLIYSTVYAFAYRHMPHVTDEILEELVSEANLHFMSAYFSYQESKASFPTWVRTQIQGRLYNLCREQRHYESHLKQYARQQHELHRHKAHSGINLGEIDPELFAFIAVVRANLSELEALWYGKRRCRVHRIYRYFRERGWSKQAIYRSLRKLYDMLIDTRGAYD